MNREKLEEKYIELMKIVNNISNYELREAVEKILIENKEKLMSRAGSPDRIENGIYYKGGHHFFKGGLLCHLLETTEYAVNIANTSGKKIDMDLIIAGACLHDIGKTITYEEWNDEEQIKNPATFYANMVQHSYLGMKIISEYFNNINERTKIEILHIVASHMSRTENIPTDGALVVPTTIEAKIVSQADCIDCLLCNYEDKV